MKRRIIAMLLAIVMLVGNVPVQAFATDTEPQETTPCPVEGCTYGAGHSGECSTFVACTVEGCTFALDHEGNCSNYVAPEELKAEPAADAAVYVTVSDRGELGMAYEAVTVSDINADGKLTVDEALYAAHTVYGKGYTSHEGTVTQLWGVETTNVSFFVNHEVISLDVNAETVSDGDYLVASVDQDAVNDYDKYSRFDVLETSVKAGAAFSLTLTDDAGNALAGMEIGLSNGNGSTTMTGLTTDVNGAVTLTLDQEGLYCITAKGTVVESSIDVNTMEITSIETPIIAPVCVVTVSGATEQATFGWSSTSSVAATNAAVLANASVSELYEIQTGVATVNQNWIDATAFYLDADVVSHTRIEGTNEFNVVLAENTDTTAAIGLEADLLSYKQNQIAVLAATVSVNGTVCGTVTTSETGVAGTNGVNGAWPGYWTGGSVTPGWTNGKADVTLDLTAHHSSLGDQVITYVLHLVIEGNEGPSEVAVESVALDKSEATLEIGETVTLSATVSPEDATDKTVTWTSDNNAVAQVVDGTVTAIGAGTATITATAGEKTATCAVTVTAEEEASGYVLDISSYDAPNKSYVSVSAITIGGAEVVGTPVVVVESVSNYVKNAVIDVVLAKGTAADAEIDLSIVHTSKYSGLNGAMKYTGGIENDCVNPGDAATGTVQLENGVGKTEFRTAYRNNASLLYADWTINFTVEDADSGKVAVEKVELNKTETTIEVGATETLTATVTPDNATEKAVTWSSDNTAVATVADGVVTAIKAGTATITAKAGEKTATCTVTVTAAAAEYVLDLSSQALPAGQSGYISSITFSGAEVSGDPKVTVANVTASPPVNTVVIDVVLAEGTAANAAVDLSILQAGQGTNMATMLNYSGDITKQMVSAGATVTSSVQLENGTGKSEFTTVYRNMQSVSTTWTINFTVEGADFSTVAVEKVELNKTETTIEVGATETLTATVTPNNATEKAVTWSSDNTAVATVVDGVVTAVNAGTATITATAGEKTATCTVTVNAPAPEMYEIQTGVVGVKQNYLDMTSLYIGADVVSHTRKESTNEFTVVLAEDTDTTAAIPLEMDLLACLQNQYFLSPSVAVNGTVCGEITGAESGVEDKTGQSGAWPGWWTGGSVTPAWENGKADVVLSLKRGNNPEITYTLHLVIEGNEGPTEVAVENIELNKSEATLEIGETVTLTATVSPEDATNKTVTWSSDNTAVATVVDGVVTAVNAGTATITATAGEKTATCTVTVNAPAPEMYEIQTGVATVNQNWIDATAFYLDADVVSHTRIEGTNEFNVVLAENTDTTAAIGLEADLLSYKQNQIAVLAATVSVNGTVCGTVTTSETGVAGTNGENGAWPGYWTGGSVTPGWTNGKADVTLDLTAHHSSLGDQVITYVLHLVIEGNEGPSEVAVESVALDKNEATLEIGETITLTATVSPEDATNKTVSWSSDNDAVATVIDGVVTAVSEGSATITATAGDKSATCTVTVSAQEAGVYQIDTGVTAVTQNYLNATAIRFGADVLYCNPSSNNANEYFVVLAADTDKTAAISLEMDLLAYSQSQYSSSPSVSVNSYKSGTITAADTGVEGAWPGTWTGATVTPTWDENGEATLVFSLKIGRNAATMYKLNLVIGREVSEVTLNRTETAMRLGETLTLVPTVKPTYTADATVDWSTSDPAVVTVADGVVTAAGLGAATITAEIGGKTASCTVTVVADTSFVIQTNDKAVLGSGDQFQEAYITEIDVGGMDVAFSKILQTATTEMQIYIILDENTPDDATVLLDFTLGAVVSPDSAKVTGADPTAVKLENGKATYEVQALNYANSPSHKYTIVLRNSNAVPALKEGVPAETSVELLMQEQYNVNLAEIFGDADGDDLNYTVTIGEETTKIDAEYTYEAWETGEHTLVFKANDGFEDSAVYTVKVKVTESGERFETTVKVPNAITPSFYMTQGYEDDGTDKLGGELTAEKGESKDGWTSYTVSVPGSISRISVRGTADTIDWGGMAFAVEENAVITLRQVNAIISSKIVVDDVEVCPNEEQALFKVEYADEVGNRFAVPGSSFNDQYGFLGYRFLLVAADNSLIYTYYAEPLGDVAKDYSTNVGVTKTITTDSADVVTTTLPLGAKSAFSITAPVEATVQMFSQTPGNYYGNVKIPAFESKENGDGTKTVTFNVTSGTATTYRVSMEGKITKAGYLSGDSVTVTWDENDPSPNYRRNYEFDENGYYKRADDSILVNVNHRNNLRLNVGQTHTLRSYRIWQIINNDTQNIMIEPDFHVNIISGKDVISLTEKADYQGNGTGKWMDITALKAGTAVLEVTYDAIEILEREAADYEINGMGGLTFNACDPVRTALVVVQVGAAEADVNFGIVNNGGNVWDAEHDTLYFLGNQGQLTFAPSSASGISSVAVSSDNGVNWSYLEASSGNYTANIAPGNNIIRVTTSAGAVSYQVVRGDKLSYTVSERMTDAEGNALTADGDGLIEAGETVEISFTGQHNPYGKMSGIYNPWTFFTKYTFNGTQTSGAAGMYIYAHYSKVYLTIPEDAKLGDEYTLTGGYTVLATGWGGSGGGHRTVGNVVPPNLDAPNNTASAFNIFPDITIKVGDSTAVEETVEAESVSLDQTVATVEAGKTLTLTATVTPDNAADKTVEWKSSNTAVAQVSKEGIVTAVAKGTATITVTITNGKTATCEVTVTEAAPEVPELDFGLAENEIVGYATVSFVDNGVRLSSDLATMEEQYKTPLGTIVAETKVPFKAYDTVAAVTLRLLDALKMTASYSGNENSGFYLSSIGNFTVGETTYTHFGEFDAGTGSGWMITQNDVFINKGASEFYVKEGDEIKWQYTCQLGADIGDTHSREAVEAVEKLINDIGDVTLDSEDAIEAAREAYDKLAPVQQAAVSNYETLTTAEAALAALKVSEEDKNAANNVINLIEAIGDEITEESKEEIEAAREAFDALTDNQKKLVTNYDDLTAAEDYLELLTRVDADIANIYTITGNYLAGKDLGTGSTNGEWAALGLARSGRTVAASYYEAVAATVKSNRLHEVKSTENSRLILALTAIGKDVTDVNGYNLLSGLNEMSYITKQGINGAIYALIALDAHDYTPVGVTRNDLITVILDAQIGDGGWSLSNVSEVDLTAMAIQALAPYYSSNTSVKAAVDKALTWLSNAQNQDGSFSTGDGANAESIAQVIVALTALGIDPDEDSRFIKTGITPVQALAQFYVEGGGFEHIANTGRDDMATEQGYYALAAYARFKAGQTALYDMSDVTLETNAVNQAAANNVIGLINAIGTVDLTKEDEIEAARAAYDALTETQKDLVTNYKTLTDAETALAQLKQTAADTAAADAVKAQIDAIGTVTSTSQADEIEAARRAYNALTTLQKNLVGAAYLNKLEDAEDALAALEKAEADEAAAQRVENLISAIGSNINLGSETKIKTARNAYDALTADQKARVSNYQTLVNAEAVLNTLKSTVTVTFSLLGCYKHGTGETTVHTLAGGNLQTWIAAKTYKVQPGATVKDLFEQALTAAGLTWKNPTGNYVESITRNGVTIGEFTNGTKSGWMYTLNGKHPGLGVNQQTLVNGDKVVFHYSDDYTKEEGNPSGTSGTTTGTGTGTVSGSTNYITTTTTTVNTETAESVDRLIEDIGEEITLESEAKILAARAAYDKLTEAQKKLVEKYEDLVAAEAKLAELKGVSGESENAYIVTGDYIQGLGTPGVGTIGGEWMVIGLARSGRSVPSGYYDHVLNYVRENINANEQLHSAKSSDNSRLILALTAIGKDVTNVDGHDLLMGLNDMDYIQKQGINGPIWALLAFDSGNYPVPEGNVSRTALIDVILEAQLDDGGWALSGERSDPDMTGMAIQALVPYMESNMDVKKAVEEAIWTLSEMQNDNGSFSSVDGPNSESIAQVITALAALGIDADTDARFVKNGISALDALLTYYIPGGGFRHVLDGNLDGMSTEQAYYALVAYNRMKQDQNFLYDMTDVIDRGGDVIVEETTQPTELPTEPVEEEEEDTGNDVVIWTSVMTLCAAAIAVILLNRKKLFGKFQ